MQTWLPRQSFWCCLGRSKTHFCSHYKYELVTCLLNHLTGLNNQFRPVFNAVQLPSVNARWSHNLVFFLNKHTAQNNHEINIKASEMTQVTQNPSQKTSHVNTFIYVYIFSHMLFFFLPHMIHLLSCNFSRHY